MKMPFGKYKGCELNGLPDHYLKWLYTWDSLRSPLKEAVLDEIQRRIDDGAYESDNGSERQDEPKPPDKGFVEIRIKPDVVLLASIVFEAGYRAVALKAHPDMGGSPEIMTRLNLLAESMRAQFKALMGDPYNLNR